MVAWGGIFVVDGEVREVVERLNGMMGEAPYKLAFVPVGEFELLEKNARFMRNEMFRNLVDNVKRDGGLTSAPFCVKTEDGKYRVLSGNHRVMAAREAGLSEVLVMYTDKPLSKQEEIAIQLSHNAIAGEDDPVILKELWNEIEDVSLKFYSGLDDKLLKELEKVSLLPLQEVDLDFRTMSIVFLPEEADRLKEVLDKALSMVSSDDILVARLEDFSRVIDATSKTQTAYGVKNVAVSISVILDVFENHLVDLQGGWIHEEPKKGRNAPAASIFATDNIPMEYSVDILKGIELMLSRGDIKKTDMWKGVYILFKKYLEGGM
jgi:hypothetical protein